MATIQDLAYFSSEVYSTDTLGTLSGWVLIASSEITVPGSLSDGYFGN